MRTIEVDEDVYQFILRSAEEIGESASSILRRLLRIPKLASGNGATAVHPPSPPDPAAKALLDFVSSSELQLKRTATEKYLAILSFLHRTHPDSFETLLEVSGRHRKYFGASREEIAESGNSTHPRQIPDSRYWALTNADTYHKRDILRQALLALGYDNAVALQATKVLR